VKTLAPLLGPLEVHDGGTRLALGAGWRPVEGR